MAYIISNGISSDSIVLTNDSMTILDGGTANNTTVGYFGFVYVSSGGVANSTTFTDYGIQHVYSGGTANGTVINPSGHLYVSSGGTANNTVNVNGYFQIVSGGVANSTIASSTETHVFGTAYDTVICPGGSVYVHSTGVTDRTTVSAQGQLLVSSGGLASNTTISAGGWLYLYSGAKGMSTTVLSGGSVYVFSGGTVTIAFNPCRTVSVSSMTGATVTYLSRNAAVYYCNKYDVISKGGTAELLELDALHKLFVYSGGTASNIEVDSGGTLFIGSGGVANAVLENGGYVNMEDGAEATFLSNTLSGGTLSSGTSVSIHSGTLASAFEIKAKGALHVFSGGTANDTIVSGQGIFSVFRGGRADDTQLYSNGSLCIAGDAIANNTIISKGGVLFVLQGGTANSTTVYGGGYIAMSSGTVMNDTVFESAANTLTSGTLNNTLVKSGTLTLGSGCVLSHTTINSQARVLLGSSSGCGKAYDTTILSGGTLTAVAGTYASDVVVNSGGTLFVSQGAEVYGIVENGGYVTTEAGASMTFAPNAFSGLTLTGLATVHSGTTATDITVNKGGKFIVYNGGSATILENGGYVYINPGANVTFQAHTIDSMVVSNTSTTVHSGTSVVRATVSAGGNLYISSGGVVDSLVWDPCVGHVFFEDGASVTFAKKLSGVYYGSANQLISKAETFSSTINSGYKVCVMSGGTAINNSLRGSMCVYSDGLASNTNVSSRGSLSIFVGGVASQVSVTLASLYVFCGATANDVVVNVSGNLQVSSGGVANGIVIASGVSAYSSGSTVTSGGSARIMGTANDITVSAYGRLYVSNGGITNNTTLGAASGTVVLAYPGAELFVGSGGLTNKTLVCAYAVMAVSSGGMADDTTVKGGGKLVLSDGGMANSTTLSGFEAKFVVSSGGIASNTMEINGMASVCSLGKAYKTTLGMSGSMFVSSGGLANDTTVESGGKLYVLTGATADSVNVGAWGNLFVSSGGKLTGKMLLDDDSLVSFAKGAVVDFDLSTLTPTDAACVNNLSVISGAPVYTITVGESQKAGAYTLAGNVYSFGSAITVNNTRGEKLGTLSAGETLDVDGILYTLNLTGDDSLVLNIAGGSTDEIAPTVSDVRADITAPTKGNVTVTAVFADDVALASSLYKIGTYGIWTDYEDGVTVTENATVYFKAVDASGNESEIETYIVANIDRVPPAAPTASADVTETTGGNVLVTATFSEDSEVCEYSLDGEVWQTYTESIEFASNGTISFRGIDEAGNISEVTSYTVDNIVENIDTVAPTAPAGLDAIVSGQKVALVWDASTDDSSGVKEYVVTYSLGGVQSTARTYGTSYVLKDAGFGTWSWSVQAVDFAGNESAVVAGDDFTVSENVAPQPGPEPEPENIFVAKCDIDGTGISDVMFRWTGGDHQVGFWMNGTSDWQSQARARSDAWTVLGGYDMDSDGKADMLLAGKATLVDMTGTYIGYYAGAVDDDANWHTVGFLVNANDWVNAVGNLTGAAGKNSVVWFAPELCALGVWTDGTDDWVSISNSFDSSWALVGCGDFDGDGRDSVVMTLNNGQAFYTADLDGSASSLGSADWSGWTVRAIGDFAGDGKDDMVLFHQETGSMVMFADGSADSFESIGQLDAKDWFVVGAGDYNGDQKDDLLVRQYSTGMLGYYTSGDTTQWNVLGYGVDMSWTVIA